jgi:hypothetical protein
MQKLVVLALVACKSSSDPTPKLEAHYERGVESSLGITTKVTCPKVDKEPAPGDKLVCKATVDGKQVDVIGRVGADKHHDVVVRAPDGIYLPAALIDRALAKSVDHAGATLRCSKRALFVSTGQRAYCEVVRDGKPIGLVRVKVDDVATEKWDWKVIDLPGKNLENLISGVGHVGAKVECPPFTPDPGTTIECKGFLGAETFEATVTAVPGDIVTEFRNDRRVLPAQITIDKKPITVRCAKWIPKVGEPVRCSYELDGKPGQVDMTVSADNRTAITEVK